MKKKTLKHCCVCANPNINDYRNSAGLKLTFHKKAGGVICNDCEDFLTNHSYFSKDYFNNELENFFLENRRILFAYSGGLDSTAVLFKLSNECKLRNIELEVFTVDTGFKGLKTINNVNQVIDFLGLTDKHSWTQRANVLNYSSPIVDLIGHEETTANVYRHCWKNSILPCGKVCNSIMEAAYQEIMQDKGYNILFTGGDTPKINSDNKYSIFWHDGKTLTVRGGYAFGLSKKMNDQLIRSNNIPWANPRCGGYDTDCLVPGAFFAKQLNGNNIVDVENLYKIYPIIFYYLTERTRFNIINRKDSLKMMKVVDVSDLSSYIELNGIM